MDKSQPGFMLCGLTRWMCHQSYAGLSAGIPSHPQMNQQRFVPVNSLKRKQFGMTDGDRKEEKKKVVRKRDPIHFSSLNLKQGNFHGKKGGKSHVSSCLAFVTIPQPGSRDFLWSPATWSNRFNHGECKWPPHGGLLVRMMITKHGRGSWECWDGDSVKLDTARSGFAGASAARAACARQSNTYKPSVSEG